MNDIVFESSLTIEEIEDNFNDTDLFLGIMAGLREAIEYAMSEDKQYYATEIDKYAIKTTQHNYPDTIQLGDAFQVRDADWTLPG